MANNTEEELEGSRFFGGSRELDIVLGCVFLVAAATMLLVGVGKAIGSRFEEPNLVGALIPGSCGILLLLFCLSILFPNWLHPRISAVACFMAGAIAGLVGLLGGIALIWAAIFKSDSSIKGVGSALGAIAFAETVLVTVSYSCLKRATRTWSQRNSVTRDLD